MLNFAGVLFQRRKGESIWELIFLHSFTEGFLAIEISSENLGCVRAIGVIQNLNVGGLDKSVQLGKVIINLLFVIGALTPFIYFFSIPEDLADFVELLPCVTGGGYDMLADFLHRNLREYQVDLAFLGQSHQGMDTIAWSEVVLRYEDASIYENDVGGKHICLRAIGELTYTSYLCSANCYNLYSRNLYDSF
jgi:hypothetical protein